MADDAGGDVGSPKSGESSGGPSKRKKASRSTKSTAKGGSSRKKAKKKASRSGRNAQVREVGFSRETLVSRVNDARRTTMVVLGFRAGGGAVITLAATMISFWVLSVPVSFIRSVWAVTFLGVGVGALLVMAARFATMRSLPEPASALPFLKDVVFTWVDPFRDDRPHLLPMWLEAILWAPSQVLVGALPLMRVRLTGPADARNARGLRRGQGPPAPSPAASRAPSH